MVFMEKAEPRTWLSRCLLLAVPSCLLFAALSSCSEPRIIGTAVAPEDGGTFSPLAPIDASAPDAAAELLSYCPSSQCPPGWTTCADSRFPCDTNILADPTNCGGCGLACPPGSNTSKFTCNEGACALQCDSALGFKDCDGIVDNGCESGKMDPEHCGACGVACAAGESCTFQDETHTAVGCGCPAGKVDCGGCKDLSANDQNCGTCNNACDVTAAPEYENMYYGCLANECGKLKCASGFANCDGTFENGCETSLYTDDACGACGNKCAAGQTCAVDERGVPSCVCGPGLTFCRTGEMFGLPQGYCADLRSSEDDCGACGVSCEVGDPRMRQVAVCDFGKCVPGCVAGRADCNGAESDGCEIDTNSDPRNCGGCGITCELTMGQACVAGKCVVEPCDQADAGELTR